MEIPLFPLPNLVLFPHVAVPLHIFEDRYRLMINRCIDNSEVFGLVLLREDAESESEAAIYPVGVTARVVQVERLDDGRLNILAAGESRFRIRKFTASSPYWAASVDLFDDVHEPEDELRDVYDETAALYRQAAELTAKLKESDPPSLDLPDSAGPLSFMISYILDMGSERKQELLEMTSTAERLHTLSLELQVAIGQLESQVARKNAGARVKGNGDLGKPHGAAGIDR